RDPLARAARAPGAGAARRRRLVVRRRARRAPPRRAHRRARAGGARGQAGHGRGRAPREPRRPRAARRPAPRAARCHRCLRRARAGGDRRRPQHLLARPRGRGRPRGGRRGAARGPRALAPSRAARALVRGRGRARLRVAHRERARRADASTRHRGRLGARRAEARLAARARPRRVAAGRDRRRASHHAARALRSRAGAGHDRTARGPVAGRAEARARTRAANRRAEARFKRAVAPRAGTADHPLHGGREIDMARVRAGWIRRCRTAGRASAAIAGFACVLAGALSAGSARAALLVYEPFDYAAGTVLDGVPATGTNLAGTWTPLGAIEAQKLVVSSPGLDYGNLAGAPPALGNRANDVNGVTAAGGTVSLASPLLVPPDSAIYWSVLLLLDDSLNGNRLANVTLADADTGDAIGFGEAGVGVRAIRITADTAATGGLVAEGADG